MKTTVTSWILLQFIVTLTAGDADVVTLDGGDLYAGGDKIAPIVGESYDVGGDNPDASYWAVAIARKGTQFGMDGLAGRKSCHTGIGKTSGWNVPVGHLIKNDQIFVNDGCDVPMAVGKFEQNQTMTVDFFDFFVRKIIILF